MPHSQSPKQTRLPSAVQSPHVQWLLKSEPHTFSIQMLTQCPSQIEPWNGVRNYQARNYLQDMKVGDYAFFYHSSCPLPGIVGLVQIVRAAYPDPTQWDPLSPYWDPRSPQDKPRWCMVDVQWRETFAECVPLRALKLNPALQEMPLTQKRCRLSVMPVLCEESAAIWHMINRVRPA